MTSATIFTTIPYCTICYLLYQEFLTACVYPLSITGFLIVSANISNASSTTYHISYNSCFSYFLVLFVSIYCISQLLESATLFSIVFLLGRFYYQVPVSGPSISVAFVLATRLSYVCHLFT